MKDSIILSKLAAIVGSESVTTGYLINTLKGYKLEYKGKLFTAEKRLYGSKGKELWEYEEQEKLKPLQKIIDAKEKEKSQKQVINEEKWYQKQ